MRHRYLFIAFIFVFAGPASSQTLDWWANNVHWDGITSWKRYMIFSAAYMGPNALPVPEIGNGSIDSTTSLGITGNFHFREGDHTQNIKLIGNYVVAKGIMSADVCYIPMEWFQTSQAVKTERHVYYMAYDKSREAGDVYLNVNLQVLNKLRDHIQLALRIGYRFPTGSITGDARYTDSPGYYFDASCGKPLRPNGPLKLLAMFGFYVWQTNQDRHFQDDAFLFGAGMEYNKHDWRVQLSSCAYFGYMQNGDQPVLIRLGAEKKINRSTAILRFQQGLHDFRYSTVEAGAKWRIGK